MGVVFFKTGLMGMAMGVHDPAVMGMRVLVLDVVVFVRRVRMRVRHLAVAMLVGMWTILRTIV
jgi:hypothetical protein